MARIVIDLREPRGRISVTPSWTISAMEKAKGLPGRKKFVDRVMHFELTEDNLAFVKAAFPMAEFIGDKSSKRGLANGPRMPFVTAKEMNKLQVEAFAASRGKLLFAFFEKPGSGKTKMILDKAVDHWCSGDIDGLLVFSYAGVHEQWILDELPKHVHPSIPVQTAIWKSGKKMQRDILKPDGSKFRVLAMNYEAFSTSDAGARFARDFSTSGNIAIALDESQRVKTPDSAISEAIVSQRELWPVRIIASGEPTPLGIQDYYQQFCVLDPAIIGAWTYAGFRGMYCRMGGINNARVVGYQNQENLHRLMAPYVHIGAPDIAFKKVYEVSRFSLSARCRAAYDQMRRDLLVELDGRRVYNTRYVLPMLNKLQEIACGRITERDGTVNQIDTKRLELLQTLLDIYPTRKAIVWSRFKEDHRLQARAFGEKAAVYNGDTPTKDRRDIIQSFLDPAGGIQYLLASEAAAGTGLNLQGHCSLNIYYSPSSNAGNRWQSEMRTYRIGVQSDVLYYDMIARNTFDVGILNSNIRKREVSDMSIEEFRSIFEETEVMDHD